MPRRYAKKKPSFRKRRFTKKRGPTIQALKALVVPDRLIVRLPYINQMSITGAAGVPLDTQYRLNSIFDPEVSVAVGQSQALGSNQWSAFYNRYRVIGVNVMVTARNTNGDATYVGMVANNDTGALISESAYEQSRSKFKLVGSTNGGHDVVTLKKYFNLASLTGRPKFSYIADDKYEAVMGAANPTEVMHLHLCTQPASPSIATAIHATIKMVYLVELFDRKALPQSF